MSARRLPKRTCLRATRFDRSGGRDFRRRNARARRRWGGYGPRDEYCLVMSRARLPLFRGRSPAVPPPAARFQ
eukprot:9273136-Lingulodinium_polyedra.AAC.1